MTDGERGLRRHLIQRWFEPAKDEPATAYFSRLTGCNLQVSARVFADDMGFDGRRLDPADCLDAVSHLEIEGMDRLIRATPIVTARTVRLLGVEVRRRHWSDAPRVCPGCLAESAHHRTYHSLIVFTECPFHGCRIVEGVNGPLGWWHPHRDRAPDGTLVSRPMPRNPNPLPTFELWLLGRLGVGEPVVVPLLEDISTIKAIDAVDLLGRAHLGGWRVPAPRTGTKGFPRADVMRTGFDILSRGTDALEALFESIAAQGAGKVGPQGCQWGLQQMFGWLYYALHYASRKPDQLEAIGIAAATVAHRRGTFGSTATSLPSVVEPLACLHQHEVGRAIGIEVRFVNAIALRLGIEPVPSHDRFVMYEATAVSLIQEALARSLKRSDAARALGLDKTELDALVRMGRIQPLCRLGGTTAADDLYRIEDIQALLPGLDLPLQSPNTEALLTLAGYAKALGLPRSEIIEMWAIGRLRPVARVTGQTGFSALAFEPPTAKEIDGVRPSARKPGGRFRRQRARPGLTKCDAASMLGISMPTLAELMRRGYVASLGHEATGTSRTRVDEHSLRAFAMQYASAVTYADVLGCGRTYTVEKLRQLGVEIILKEPGQGHLMAMVRRSDVTSALGLDRDPLTTNSSGWITFWSAFGEHLASKGSIFRLIRITSAPDNRLQSGDRRTVISVEMDAEGRTILRQETGQGADEGTFAVREGFALQDRRSWPQLFVWLETSAYLLRSAGGRGSAAA